MIVPPTPDKTEVMQPEIRHVHMFNLQTVSPLYLAVGSNPVRSCCLLVIFLIDDEASICVA